MCQLRRSNSKLTIDFLVSVALVSPEISPSLTGSPVSLSIFVTTLHSVWRRRADAVPTTLQASFNSFIRYYFSVS